MYTHYIYRERYIILYPGSIEYPGPSTANGLRGNGWISGWLFSGSWAGFSSVYVFSQLGYPGSLTQEQIVGASAHAPPHKSHLDWRSSPSSSAVLPVRISSSSALVPPRAPPVIRRHRHLLPPSAAARRPRAAVAAPDSPVLSSPVLDPP